MGDRISVIVVNWNGLEFLPDCLSSLERQEYPADEIIVVDNGSRDGSADYVREHHPGAILVETGRNLGFAGGANAGIRQAHGDLIATINNDMVLSPQWIKQMVLAAGAYPAFGMIASTITFSSRPDIIASAGIEVRRDGVITDRLIGQAYGELAKQNPYEVFGPSAGAAVYRRKMLDDVGLFDESYFAYLEDADLAWRARLRGRRCLLIPNAFATHRYSATSGQESPFKSYHLARNRVRTIFKDMPAHSLVRHGPSILLYDMGAIAYALATHRVEIIRGRIDALREAPALLRTRTRIQRARKITNAEFERLLAAPAGLARNYGDRKWLNKLLVEPEPGLSRR
ncbi:MAG: glycosyltransferase family 2 protein [Chloroflexi bacterium]|nr:glycosyltransferase family 2 protein [Chloroflexota bacterium]